MNVALVLLILAGLALVLGLVVLTALGSAIVHSHTVPYAEPEAEGPPAARPEGPKP